MKRKSNCEKGTMRRASGLAGGMLLAAVLLAGVMPAAAQTTYVIKSGNYFLTHNEAGTTVNTAATSVFSPKTCFWTVGNKRVQTANSTGTTISGNHYLQQGSLSLGNSQQLYQAAADDDVIMQRGNWSLIGGYTYYYLRLNNTTWERSTTNNNVGVIKSVTIRDSALVNPTLTLTARAGVTSGGIQLVPSISGRYAPACKYASVDGTGYYWGNDYVATDTRPGLITDWTTDVTITYEVTTGGSYASVSSDGLVTFTANPTGSVVVRMSVSKEGYSGSTTITLTRGAVAQAVTASISAPVITPASAALYMGEEQAFSVAASVLTNTVPAHTKITASGNTYYYYSGDLYASTDGFRVVDPGTPTFSWALSGDAATYLTRTPASGATTTVRHATQAPSDLTGRLTVTATAAGAANQTAYVGVNAYVMTAPVITREGNDIRLATATAGAAIRYTTDGSTPTADHGTLYSGAFALTASPTTVKAVSVRDGHLSAVTEGTYQMRVATPVVTISPAGQATIACSDGAATVRYSTDNGAHWADYTSAVALTNPQTIMAFAQRASYMNSDTVSADFISEGAANGYVILDDREDHLWTYYSGIDPSVDGGNYNTNYLGKMYSPNPRNVKITYRGKNDVAGSSTVVKVSRSENDSVFIYYKTLEEGGTSGEYPYQVISNPFSVRPSEGSGNSKVYYGFAGWKIVRGGEYIKNHSNGDVLSLDEEIVFNNLPYPSANCTSAEIVFQTSWTVANVQTGSNINTMVGRFSGGTYETNFAVLTGSYTTAWTGNKNVTVTSVYPDGSSDVRSNSNYTRLNVTVNAGYTVKYEYININNSNSTLSMNTGNKTLYIGRGVSNTAANGVVCNLIQGCDGNISSGGLTYTLKIESGIYNYLSYTRGYNGDAKTNTITGTVAIKSVLGCDYDRAKADNTKLKIQEQIMMGYTNSGTQVLRSPAAGDEVLNVTLKSGSLNSNLASAGTADASDCFYIGIGGEYSPGARVFTMEGGEMWSLAAGICKNTATTNSVRFRIKGGLVKGSIYGSAANANSYGYKQMIITGGQVKGWIAGGGNGTSANGGTTTGSSYVYIGGNSRIDSEGSGTKINSSLGGQVFGSGSGVEGSTTWGEMLYGSNVVVGDNAYVERDVFGGGNFGWTDQTANIYLTGGDMSVGNVYGGANQNKGQYVNIYMTGGHVRNGLYGGSNASGTIEYNVAMRIAGGQVGTSAVHANVYGGGCGSGTAVNGNVSVAIGNGCDAANGATIWGDVYGGADQGVIGRLGNPVALTLTTEGGEMGNIYGGSRMANVYGSVKVNVYGGSIDTLYGGNNVSGSISDSIVVNVEFGRGSNPACTGTHKLNIVYGGGNDAAYAPTAASALAPYYSPRVSILNVSSAEHLTHVFGGGRGFGAEISKCNPLVVIGDSNSSSHAVVIDTLANGEGGIYGGGDAADVGTSTNRSNPRVVVTSHASTANTTVLGSVYGGGRGATANIKGNPAVRILRLSEVKGNVYGGGNAGPVQGNPDVKVGYRE